MANTPEQPRALHGNAARSEIGRAAYRERTLLLVGTGGVKRRAVLQALRALGLARIVCLHDEPNWAAPYVDDWILGDSVRPATETFAAVEAYFARHGFQPHGVLTYDEYSVVAAAHLAAHLGCIGIAPGAAEIAKHKHRFRTFCRERGLPSPRAALLSPDAPEDTSAAAALTFPLVVKPVEGSGSVFVRRVAAPAGLRAALAEYARSLRAADVTSLWRDASLLVEEYLAGEEVDIDILMQRGQAKYLAISDNHAPREPYFLEEGGRIPSALPADAQRALATMAIDVLRAMGIDDGCVHFEAKMTPRGPFPIEANLRLGGAEVYAFNRGAWGVDLVEGALRIALGLDVPQFDAREPNEHLASGAFNPPHAGVIRSISVDEGVTRSPALAELCLFKSAGDRIEVPPRGYEYSGWIVARGATGDEADANLTRLRAGVRIEIAPDTPPSIA